MKWKIQQVWKSVLQILADGRSNIRLFKVIALKRVNDIVVRLYIFAAATTMFLILATVAHAQNSQFVFDDVGNLTMQVADSAAAPQIIGQPQMQIVIPGETASFSVLVADTLGVSYQWLFNGSAIAGATADSFLVTNASTNNEGLYSVIVSNGAGSVPSSPANLYIDSNANGLPDSWEIAHFGNLNQTATGDPDGDGISNLQEFLDGTDPTNNASALYRITLLADGGMIAAVPNQTAYTKGQVVTLTAIGTNEAPFHAWTGDITTRSNSITFTVNTNMTLFAHFLPFTFVWTNTLGGDWSGATNWTPNLAPGSDENVLIPITVLVTLNSDVNLADFTLGAVNAGPELTGSGRLAIAGTGTWLGGIMSGIGATVVLPGASFTIANNTTVSLNGRTFENAGMTTWLAGGNFNMNGSLFTNDVGGQFQLMNPSSFNNEGGTPRFDNSGTLSVTNAAASFAGIAFNNIAFNNYGVVNIQDGALMMSDGGVNAGMMIVAAGSTLNFANGNFTSSGSPSITGAGELLVSSGNETFAGTVNVSGSNVFSGGNTDFTGGYVCTNNTMVVSGGSVSFDGVGLVMPSVLNLSGGQLGGVDDVTVGRAMNWTSGDMAGTGRTVILPAATLTINNPSSISIASRTLDNRGTALWSGTSMLLGGAVITNELGALFQVQSQSPVYLLNNGGSPRFDNGGTFNSTGSGTATFNVPLNNFNTVGILGGVLAANDGYSSSSNAVLNCAIAGTIPGTNYGQLQVAGAVTLNGTFVATLKNNYIPTTNDSFTVVTSGTVNGAFANFIYPSNKLSMVLSSTPTAVIVHPTSILTSPQPSLLPLQISGGNVNVTWTAVSNTAYRLEFNSNLAPSNWIALPGDVTALSNSASKFDAFTSSNRFYRVHVLP